MKKFTFLFVFAVLANLFLGSTAFGQITQVTGSPQSATTTGTTLTITRPSGLAVGDVMIANIVQSDNDGADGGDLSNATLSGWTLIAGNQTGIVGSGGDEFWGTLLYRVATASDVSAANFAFSLDAEADDGSGAIMAFRGVDLTGGVTETGAVGGPFDVDPGSVYENVSSDQTLNANAITTATANAAVIMFGVLGDNVNLSAWSTTNPGSLTEIYDLAFDATLDMGSGSAWAIKAATGSTGGGTATISGGNNIYNGGILLALKHLVPPPSVTLTPSTTQNIFSGSSVSFTAAALNYPAGGNYTYDWTVTPAVTLPGLDPNTIAAATDVKNIVFPNGGTYTVSVNITRAGTVTNLTTAATTVNVSAPNLWSANGTGNILKYTVDPVTGNILAGPANVIVPSTSTAALAKNKPLSLNDANGCLYYLNRDDNDLLNGVVTIYAVNPDGTGNGIIGTIDMNGPADNTDFSFVRLGFDPFGRGWILAGGNTTPIYIASFLGKGVAPGGTLTLADINTYGNLPLTVAAPGSSTEFQNGDLAFTASGVLYALANVTGGQTYIYTLNSTTSPTTLTRKWTVQTAGGTFSGSVNGLAWTQSGSLHFSTGTGIFFINQATASTVFGTVQATLVPGSESTTLTDLASDKFPTQSTLPVSLGTFTVTKQGTNSVLSWTTLTEANSDHFEIERSYDGINFSVVGTKQAAGTSNSERAYQYIDAINTTSKIIYYRLRTVDIDAKSSLSKIVALRLSGTIIKDFTVYPNPFTSDLKVQISSDKQTDITIRISNAAGQQVVNRKVMVQTGENVIVLSSELSTLQSGIYMMEVITEEGKKTQKIIKR